MILKDFSPHPALNMYIQNYRIIHFVFDRNSTLPFKAYPPLPEQCLMFFLRDVEQWERVDDKKIAG